MNLEQLSAAWIEAKAQEATAIEVRRAIEDQITTIVDATQEGTHKAKAGSYTVKITTRHNRKINGDLLQEIAEEHGLTQHLSSLFRWKPDINATAWKATDPSITKPLLGAITTTAGRPSFSIVSED